MAKHERRQRTRRRCRRPATSCSRSIADAPATERRAARQPGARGRHRPPRTDRGRGRPHRAGDGSAARLTCPRGASGSTRSAPGRPAERGDPDPDGEQGPVHRAARGGRPDRDRGDQLRRPARDPAAGRRGRPAHRPVAGSRRPLPGPGPEHARAGARGGGRRRRHRGLHRDDRRLHHGQHRDDGRRVARGVRTRPDARGRARLVRSCDGEPWK